MKIRKANSKDVEKIKELNKDLFLDNRRFDETLDISWPEKNLKYYQDAVVSKDTIALVAEEDGKIEGYLIGSICESEVYRKLDKIAEIDNMLVSEKLRGKGIGTQLIKEFIFWAKKNKIKRIKVSVYSSNILAVKAYEKNGFFDYSKTMEANI